MTRFFTHTLTEGDIDRWLAGGPLHATGPTLPDELEPIECDEVEAA